MNKLNKLNKLNKYVPLFTLVILVILGSALSDKFFTFNNIINIIQYSAETGLLAVGMTFVILTGGIDLSVGAIVALAAVLSAGNQNLGGVFVVVLVVIIGAILGGINGLVITKARVEPFMATLAMMAIARALTLWYTNGGPIVRGVSQGYQQIANFSIFQIPLPAIYVVVAFILGYIVLNKTPFGRHVLAVGGSEETSRLFGINVERVKMIVYIMTGILAALAGALITARLGMGEPRSGNEYELMAISMVVVGGTSLTGGRGTVEGSFIGLIIFAVIMNLMNLLNISAHIQPIVRGVIIILAALAISRRVKASLV